MTWEAGEPTQVNPREWSGRLIDGTRVHGCHFVRSGGGGNWVDGTHRTASAALACAERAARELNRGEA